MNEQYCRYRILVRKLRKGKHQDMNLCSIEPIISKSIRSYVLNNKESINGDLFRDFIQVTEKALIGAALQTFRGNQTEACATLGGICRATLRVKMNLYFNYSNPVKHQSSQKLIDCSLQTIGRINLKKKVFKSIESYTLKNIKLFKGVIYKKVINEVEKVLFEAALRALNGNLTASAKLLGVNRSALGVKSKKLFTKLELEGLKG